jgi:histidine triad (HIT) family protein
MKNMSLTDEQAKQIKEQIFKQLESFPEDKREEARHYIESLDNEQLEEFIKKNKLVKENGEAGEQEASQCVMCLISNKKIDSVQIYEDENYFAALEINPLSEGHTILIPKKHISKIADIPKSSEKITGKIAKHLIKKLEAKDVKISPSEDIGHAIINLIPIYEGKEIKNRKSTKPEELKKLKEKIGDMKEKVEVKEEKKEEPKPKPIEIIKLPRRIP